MSQQQQHCVVCSSQIPVAFQTGNNTAPPTCSLRCSWAASHHCAQCGRDIPVMPNSNINAVVPTFCGHTCADEARRGNWCTACGVRQVPQGFSRCSTKCMQATQHHQHASTMSNNSSNAAESTESPFLSRRTSPEDALKTRGKPQRTATTLDAAPGANQKQYERIVAPFHSHGLSVHQVIQLNNAPQEKKQYQANRLAVDQKLSSQGLPKIGFGGEGNEHKRFVPLMAGCGMHLNGVQCAADGAPIVCNDVSCDVCRVIGSGMKLSAMCGRTSHFSVPSFEAVIPWCVDAGVQQSAATRICAVALTRVIVGNPLIVDRLDAVQPPPIGYDSVLLPEQTSDGAPPKTDSCFTFTDHLIQPEYIVLFSATTMSTAAPAATTGQQFQ